jgi:hypothetical protein
MPSLIWVPSGAADKKDIIVPLDNFFKRMNVRHVENEVKAHHGLGIYVELEKTKKQ